MTWNTSPTPDIQKLKNDILFALLPANKDNTFSAASLADAALVASATDRQNTHSSHPSYWCNLTSQPNVNLVYIRAKNITGIRVYNGITLVGSIDDSSYEVTTEQGQVSDYKINDIAHYLVRLTLPQNQDYLTTNLLKINITGTNFEVYEIACLYSPIDYRIKAETDADGEGRLVRFDIQPTLRGYTTRHDIRGGLDFIPPIDNPPIRYYTEIGIAYDDPSWQELIPFFSENRAGFALIQEYGRMPARIYSKCGLQNFDWTIQRLVEDLKKYQNVSFTILEA